MAPRRGKQAAQRQACAGLEGVKHRICGHQRSTRTCAGEEPTAPPDSPTASPPAQGPDPAQHNAPPYNGQLQTSHRNREWVTHPSYNMRKEFKTGRAQQRAHLRSYSTRRPQHETNLFAQTPGDASRKVAATLGKDQEGRVLFPSRSCQRVVCIRVVGRIRLHAPQRRVQGELACCRSKQHGSGRAGLDVPTLRVARCSPQAGPGNRTSSAAACTTPGLALRRSAVVCLSDGAFSRFHAAHAVQDCDCERKRGRGTDANSNFHPALEPGAWGGEDGGSRRMGNGRLPATPSRPSATRARRCSKSQEAPMRPRLVAGRRKPTVPG